MVYVYDDSGASILDIKVDGHTTGLTDSGGSGAPVTFEVFVPAGGTIAISWTGSPMLSWVWSGS
jgi:hypothetical protein